MTLSSKRRDFARALALALLLVVWASAAPAGGQGGSPVIGIGDFPHGVADIAQAIAFYRDVLGLELVSTRPALVDGKIGANVYDAQMQAVMDVGGAYYRFALFRVPGAPFRLQLVEMINNQRLVGLRGRRQAAATPTERGSVMLRLAVSDVGHLLGRIRDGLYGDILTSVTPVGSAGPARFAFRDDTDGFLVEIGAAPAARAGVVLTAADASAKLRFYRDLLGFSLQTGEWESEGVTPSGGELASVRRSVGHVPGTEVDFEIREYRGIHQRRFYPSTMGQDGVGWLQLIVGDLDPPMKRFLAERVLIVSTGLQPVVFDDGSRRVVVRDPDGVFVELVERRQQAAGK